MNLSQARHEQFHELVENEQSRHRPLRNYVLRNYVHWTLIPSQRDGKAL